MTDTHVLMSLATMVGLLLFPPTRKVVKWIVFAAIGLFVLLLLSEPRLD